MLIDREKFVEIGGFDERFFMYFEDNDLCLRFGKAGYRILYTPFETVVHMYEKGAHKSRKLFKIFMQSMGKFLTNGAGGSFSQRLAVVIVLYQMKMADTPNYLLLKRSGKSSRIALIYLRSFLKDALFYNKMLLIDIILIIHTSDRL